SGRWTLPRRPLTAVHVGWLLCRYQSRRRHRPHGAHWNLRTFADEHLPHPAATFAVAGRRADLHQGLHIASGGPAQRGGAKGDRGTLLFHGRDWAASCRAAAASGRLISPGLKPTIRRALFTDLTASASTGVHQPL